MGFIQTTRFILTHPIGRRRPLGNLLGFMRWQVRSRIVSGPVTIPWVAGTRLVVERGMHGATGNLYVGLHEPDDMAFALHCLRPDDWFADVGANVGSYTILAAGVAGARVHAFEPIATSFAHLSRNVRANDLAGRVTLHRVAVGAHAGRVSMASADDTTNRVLGPGERVPGAIEVDVVRLDDALAGVSPTLIKIDVEGFEAEVLTGAATVLARSAALIVEVSRHHDEVFALVAAAGLRPCRYDGLERRLAVLERPAPSRSGNFLFVRDPEWARARCASAPLREVKGVWV